MKKLLFVFASLVMFPLAAASQTFSLKCDYPNWSDSKGLHKSREKFGMTFVVDHESDKAYMIGSEFTSPVLKIMQQDPQNGMTFIDIAEGGNVYTTTWVESSGESIHSRHSVLLGNAIPSQYYGVCEIK